ncbi:hypothetical protein [Acinetobacter sp. WCHAc060025]|uniref:hypothetical protein n=1 Tax=Acinetobacter sp. WCHAc060025 TaxID=2518625 RepID=UPI001023E868|nr:hypothetical protein [Acinetobacter sp. WCHAc060025]RZG77190.1 hypothetical protein EXE09_04615 [Acinetobacter sp. WCHAc060025]
MNKNILIFLGFFTLSAHAQINSPFLQLQAEVQKAIADPTDIISQGSDKLNNNEHLQMWIKKAPEDDLSPSIKAFIIYGYTQKDQNLEITNYMKGYSYLDCQNKKTAMRSGLVLAKNGEGKVDYENSTLVWKSKNLTGQAGKDFLNFYNQLCPSASSNSQTNN